MLHALFGEWDMLFSIGTLPADARVLAYVVSLYPSTLIAAAAFPTSASTTTAGARFLFVPVVCCSILRCFGVGLDLHHTQTHVNLACTLAHIGACAVISSGERHATTTRAPSPRAKPTAFAEGARARSAPSLSVVASCRARDASRRHVGTRSRRARRRGHRLRDLRPRAAHWRSPARCVLCSRPLDLRASLRLASAPLAHPHSSADRVSPLHSIRAGQHVVRRRVASRSTGSPPLGARRPTPSPPDRSPRWARRLQSGDGPPRRALHTRRSRATDRAK